MGLLHRVRGGFGVTLLWATTWFMFGLVVTAGRFVRDKATGLDIYWQGGDFTSTALSTVRVWTVGGAISGALFAVVLAIAERRRSVDALSVPRVALWGASATIIVPTVWLIADATEYWYPGYWEEALISIGVAAILGAGCAAATLKMARAAGN